MKKKIFSIMLAVCGLLPVACVNEVEELFDTPASQRIDERMTECQTLLTSAEHGWLIEYYPDVNRSYGGSSYAAKFEKNGDVTMTGEVAVEVSGDVGKTITSHYSINSSSSVVLTFDTYNEYIHYWSDPDDYAGNVFGGDFEFAYVSGNSEEMIFRGIKTGNRIVFKALDADIVTSVRQIVAVQEEVVDCLYSGYKWGDGVNGTIELYDDDYLNLLTYYPGGDKDGEYTTIPYSFSQEGIAFYEPTTIGGVTVQNFKWENNAFVSTDATDGSGAPVTISMTGFYSEDFMLYDKFIGSYILKYNSNIPNNNPSVPDKYVYVPVTLSEGSRYRSFILSGLGDFDLEVGYSKAHGSLSLTSQYLEQYGSYYVWLCPWDAVWDLVDEEKNQYGFGGSLTWSTSAGFNIVHNGDPENLVLTFTDNGGFGGNTVNGILIYAFSSPNPSSENVLGYLEQYPLIQTMTKIN